MRKMMTCVALLVWIWGLCAQGADSLEFPQPQFMNPIFDSFSRNYISTAAMGRGYTGVALTGGVDHVLLNPAGQNPDKAMLHLEMLIKPPVNVNYYAAEDTTGGYTMTPDDRLSSPVPFGIVGAGGQLGNFTGALLYSLPKTVKLDDFSVEMNLGGYLLSRYPTFNLHQLTANLGWHCREFNLGVNLHNQFYYVGDLTYLRTFERIRETKYVLRPQLGFLYAGEAVSAGLSVTPPQNFDWDLKFRQYDTVLPLQATLGAAYRKGVGTFTAELDFEQSSAISDAFQDRYTIRAGAEATIRRFTYRAGYAFSPEVWHGDFLLPDAASDTTAIWWDFILPGGNVKKNTQHLLSLGTSWHHRDLNLNLAFLMDVGGQAPVAQVNASLDLYFSAFRNKKFLYFD